MLRSSTIYSQLLSMGIFSVALIGCNKDESIEPSQSDFTTSESFLASSRNGKTNKNAPAAHIAASEKLVIPAAVDLPFNLPNGNTRVATYYAVGVQQYKAREKAGSFPVEYEWVFVAPNADLYDVTNAKVGTHGAGPFWQLSISDIIFAQHFSPAKTAPSQDSDSIDWLLLTPKAGTTATGIFADVDYIQRIATKGGKAPSTPPSNATETIDVKYQAVYRFTKNNN